MTMVMETTLTITAVRSDDFSTLSDADKEAQVDAGRVDNGAKDDYGDDDSEHTYENDTIHSNDSTEDEADKGEILLALRFMNSFSQGSVQRAQQLCWSTSIARP